MKALLNGVRHRPSAVLVAGQVLAVLAWPFLSDQTLGRISLGVLQLLVVFAAVAAVRLTQALTWVAVLFGIPAMVFAAWEAISPGTGWVIVASAAVHVPFYAYVSYALIRYLFHDDKVTSDELFATGAAFSVVAWAFAYLFAAVQVAWPGSFGEEQSWFRLLFLSFTNLTSVGLSDISPIGDHARSVVMLEQVAGMFYVALVVARLIGLTRPGSRSTG
jgi:hypothetical protein